MVLITIVMGVYKPTNITDGCGLDEGRLQTYDLPKNCDKLGSRGAQPTIPTEQCLTPVCWLMVTRTKLYSKMGLPSGYLLHI